MGAPMQCKVNAQMLCHCLVECFNSGVKWRFCREKTRSVLFYRGKILISFVSFREEGEPRTNLFHLMYREAWYCNAHAQKLRHVAFYIRNFPAKTLWYHVVMWCTAARKSGVQLFGELCLRRNPTHLFLMQNKTALSPFLISQPSGIG